MATAAQTSTAPLPLENKTTSWSFNFYAHYTCYQVCTAAVEPSKEPISRAGCGEAEATEATEATKYRPLVVHKVPGCQGCSGSVTAL